MNFKNKKLSLAIIISVIGLLIYYFWPTEYDRMMSEALKIRDAHPEQKVFDGEVEPPMPDKSENNKTILGVDSNHNGIRDDVEIWINRTGKNYNERMAMRQYARAMTRSFNTCEKKIESDADMAFSKVVSAKICLGEVRKSQSSLFDIVVNDQYKKECLNFFKIVGTDDKDKDRNFANGESLLSFCLFDLKKEK